MKRIIDITFSFIAFIVFFIPIIAIVAIIRIKEKHPIFFKQQRIGKNKCPFLIFKFQTMVDEKVTPTGSFLRKTGIDEIAQFFNVLKGDMSIVGPRALTQSDIERLGWDDNFHIQRWSVKPGITGFAQIYGGQNKKTSWFWDKKYSQISNVFVDLSLIVISFMMNIFGKTRVRRLIWKHKNLR